MKMGEQAGGVKYISTHLMRFFFLGGRGRYHGQAVLSAMVTGLGFL